MKILMQTPFSALNAFVIVLGLLTILQACADTREDPDSKSHDRWAPFRPPMGHWKGVGHGPTGESVQETEWNLVLNGTFLQCKSSSKARGDHHQDIGLISYDQSRKKYVYRAFHSEGFVNRYLVELSSDRRKIVFTSEAIENGPQGLKAMEVIEFKNGKLETTLKLASGVGPYEVCASRKLARVESERRD